MVDTSNPVREPNQPHSYTDKQMEELIKCVGSPMYFLENYLQIQHAIKGAIPFKPYEYQRELIEAFENNRFCIALTARQMGKSFTFYTKINRDGNNIHAGNLISLPLQNRIVAWLETILVALSR